MSKVKVSDLGKKRKKKARPKIYAGYLYQKGTTKFSKKFKKKWFVLYQGRILAEFGSESSGEMRGEIDLTSAHSLKYCDIKITDSDCYKHPFEFKVNDKLYIFAAVDTKEMNSWMDYIRSAVFGNVIHEGWLTKKGDFVKSWKRRYFVLSDNKLLRYFEDEEQTKLKGVVNVQTIQTFIEGEPVEPHWNFMIIVKTAKRTWNLNADSEQKRQEWLRCFDEGKKVINYDQSASLFVSISQPDKTTNVTCKPNKRLKFMMNLYQKWCDAHEQSKDPESRDIAHTLQVSASVDDMKLMRTESTGFGLKSGADGGKSKGIYEVLNNNLKDYNSVHLLNDFNFVLKHFDPNREHFLSLYKYILGEKKSEPSIPPQHSLMMMRNMRNRMFYAKNDVQRTMAYNDATDPKEVNAQNILDAIYCHLLYSYYTLKINATEWAKIKDYGETDKLTTAKAMFLDKTNWFAQCKDHYHLKERNGKFTVNLVFHENASAKEKNNNNKMKPILNIFKKKENAQAQNDETKVDDGDDDDKPEVFCEVPSDFNKLDVSMNHDKELGDDYYQFGQQSFEYWPSSQNNQWYVKAQFANLKEEMLKNDVCSISTNQWNTLYERATNLSSSEKAKEFLSYESYGDDDYDPTPLEEKYKVYAFTPIKINHICSLILYCNFYQLSQLLLSTYARNVKDNESIQEWKLRHSQLCNLARHVTECALVFGKLIGPNDFFYYCIDTDSVDFGKTLRVSYCQPFSGTRDVFVAQSYFKFNNSDCKTGMILSAGQQSDCMAFYMDCGWCSDFSNEQEALMIGIYPNHARIKSMVHISLESDVMTFNNYQYYMSAISDFDRMIRGLNSSDQISKKTFVALKEMIDYRLHKVLKAKHEKKELWAKMNAVVVIKKKKEKKEKKGFGRFFGKKDKNDKNAKEQTENDTEKDDSAQNDDAKDDDADKKDETNDDDDGNNDDDNKETDANEEKKEKAPEKIQFKYTIKKARMKVIPEYVKNMFDEYCMTVTEVYIDVAKVVSLKKGYRLWRDLLMNDNDTWFKLQVLCPLFPNLSTLKIDYIPQSFCRKTMVECLEFLHGESADGQDVSIEIYKPSEQSDLAYLQAEMKDKDENVEFTLKHAMDQFLSKEIKNPKFKWYPFLHKGDDECLPHIQLVRPSRASERNNGLSCMIDADTLKMFGDMIAPELKKNTGTPQNYYLSLLYRGKRDGFDADAFHERCDGIQHTITIIKAKGSGNLFGGYTSRAWGRSGEYGHDKWAFLFLLKSKIDETKKAQIINLKKGHDEYGMLMSTYGGPAFGRNDIKILNNANKADQNYCASNSFTYKGKPNLLSGEDGCYFQISNYEVFQVVFY